MVVIKDPEIILGEKIKEVLGEKDAEVYYRLMAERDYLAGGEKERIFKRAKARVEEIVENSSFGEDPIPVHEVDDELLRSLIRVYQSKYESEDDIINAAVDEYLEEKGISFE